MNKKRTRLEVVKDLLKVLQTNKKTKITHLIYKANLSNNSIKPYLIDLMKNGLIEEIIEDDKKTFKITLKGHDFLKEFEKIKIFSESYGI